MNTKNKNKIEAIKKSLEEFLNHLENNKDMIGSSKSYIYMDHQIIPYVSKDKFDLLDVATNLLKDLIKQFNSIDDLDLIKKLRESELFFLNNKNFRKFTFPDYKSLIDPILLTRVNIKMQLENLTKKAKELNTRGHKKAFGEIMGVVLSVDKSIEHYFQKRENNNFNHMNLALAIIELATPIIDHHLAWEMILLNLSLLIFTLGTAHIANKIVNNHFLFYKETETHKQLVELENTVAKLTI